MSEVTQILVAMQKGDKQAAADLMALVYDELRKLAAHHMAQEKPGQTLQPTALVHEAYLRLVGPANADGFANRQHFFGAAAEAMRRILVDQARRKGALKRSDRQSPRELRKKISGAKLDDDVLVAVDSALERFAQTYPLHAQLVKLRFFTGLTMDQSAEILGISSSAADRHWVFARAWLRRELEGHSWDADGFSSRK